MLSALSVRNIVLIDQLDLNLDAGLTVLTGETGAGKSILLDALALALGSRGDAALVRAGAESGQVVAVLQLPAGHPVRALLRDNAIADDEDLILRRVQFADGKTRAFVNDQPVSAGLLRSLGVLAVEIHGQHDDRALVDPAMSRSAVSTDRTERGVGAVAVQDARASLLEQNRQHLAGVRLVVEPHERAAEGAVVALLKDRRRQCREVRASHERATLGREPGNEDERAGRERVAMQQAEGLDVRWLDPSEAARSSRTLAPDGHRGGSFREGDGHIDPPRNVRAYGLAMQRAGVELREGTDFTGLRTDAGGRVTAVETSAGRIATARVLLTGGPSLRGVGEQAGLRIPVGAARHTVAVLEPHSAFAEPQPMVFDITAGLYWRHEEGGLLFGWSDPDDVPGEARAVDWAAYERYRERLAGYVPVTRDLDLRRIWAATIDYTLDHAPIIGPAIRPDGSRLGGVTVAAAGGHGMMWGPGIARAATDLALHGTTDVLDVTDLGLDRFDDQGRSRLATDPVTLPYPVAAD